MRKYTKIINWDDFPEVKCISHHSPNVERTICRCGHVEFESVSACPNCGEKIYNVKTKELKFDNLSKQFIYLEHFVRAEKYGDNLKLKNVLRNGIGNESINHVYRVDTMRMIITDPDVRSIKYVSEVLNLIDEYSDMDTKNAIDDTGALSRMTNYFNILYNLVSQCSNNQNSKSNIDLLLKTVGPKDLANKVNNLDRRFRLGYGLQSCIMFLKRFKPSLLDFYREFDFLSYTRINESNVDAYNNIPDELLIYMTHILKNGMLSNNNLIGAILDSFSKVETWSDDMIEKFKSYLKEMFAFRTSFFESYFNMLLHKQDVHVKDFCLIENLNSYKQNKKTYAAVEEMVENMGIKSPLQAFLEANIR